METIKKGHFVSVTFSSITSLLQHANGYPWSDTCWTETLPNSKTFQIFNFVQFFNVIQLFNFCPFWLFFFYNFKQLSHCRIFCRKDLVTFTWFFIITICTFLLLVGNIKRLLNYSCWSLKRANGCLLSSALDLTPSKCSHVVTCHLPLQRLSLVSINKTST